MPHYHLVAFSSATALGVPGAGWYCWWWYSNVSAAMTSQVAMQNECYLFTKIPLSSIQAYWMANEIESVWDTY